MEYVPEVLWSYRTTIRTPTSETPFSLTYGMEAVIPAEVGSPSFRVSHYNPRLNEEGIVLHLDLLQERREDAKVAWATYQRQVAKYFDKNVKLRTFKVGDWVLRKTKLMTRDPVEGKFAAKWEGPYRVVSCHKKMGLSSNNEGRKASAKGVECRAS